jgi:hypothetical protein
MLKYIKSGKDRISNINSTSSKKFLSRSEITGNLANSTELPQVDIQNQRATKQSLQSDLN